ncbi:hypothetical protein B6N31_00585 [Dickeya fangzhongdai]|nr:hypothetical protein B6N31_00585 [Dickeya fangzhongdai]
MIHWVAAFLPPELFRAYTRHTSSCRCVGCVTRPISWASPLRGRCQQRSNRLTPICRSPQSLTYVSSWGFTRLPPSCNSNYLG